MPAPLFDRSRVGFLDHQESGLVDAQESLRWQRGSATPRSQVVFHEKLEVMGEEGTGGQLQLRHLEVWSNPQRGDLEGTEWLTLHTGYHVIDRCDMALADMRTRSLPVFVASFTPRLLASAVSATKLKRSLAVARSPLSTVPPLPPVRRSA